jgi:hypothetical protein
MGEAAPSAISSVTSAGSVLPESESEHPTTPTNANRLSRTIPRVSLFSFCIEWFLLESKFIDLNFGSDLFDSLFFSTLHFFDASVAMTLSMTVLTASPAGSGSLALLIHSFF